MYSCRCLSLPGSLLSIDALSVCSGKLFQGGVALRLSCAQLCLQSSHSCGLGTATLSSGSGKLLLCIDQLQQELVCAVKVLFAVSCQVACGLLLVLLLVAVLMLVPGPLLALPIAVKFAVIDDGQAPRRPHRGRRLLLQIDRALNGQRAEANEECACSPCFARHSVHADLSRAARTGLYGIHSRCKPLRPDG